MILNLEETLEVAPERGHGAEAKDSRLPSGAQGTRHTLRAAGKAPASIENHLYARPITGRTLSSAPETVDAHPAARLIPLAKT
jgi:hypothetical protein